MRISVQRGRQNRRAAVRSSREGLKVAPKALTLCAARPVALETRMAAVDKLTRQMLAGEQMSSVAALARDAPEWARAFVDAAERRVRELDDALASARGDVVKLRARAEQFVAENEQLHERLAAELEREPAQPPPAPSSNGASVPRPRSARRMCSNAFSPTAVGLHSPCTLESCGRCSRP